MSHLYRIFEIIAHVFTNERFKNVYPSLKRTIEFIVGSRGTIRFEKESRTHPHHKSSGTHRDIIVNLEGREKAKKTKEQTEKYDQLKKSH